MKVTSRAFYLGSILLLAGLPALADTIEFSFATSGTVQGHPVQGSATLLFNDTAHSLNVTLENLTSPVGYVPQMLVGFAFTPVDNSGNALTVGSLISVTQSAIYNCTTGTCVTVTGTSPYGWTWNGSQLGADVGTWHPYEIVNANVDTTASGGVTNAPHNPMLVGPVEFDFTFAGDTLPTNVNSITFLWGTLAEPTSVPDGGMTLLLLGAALVGLETLRRKIRA